MTTPRLISLSGAALMLHSGLAALQHVRDLAELSLDDDDSNNVNNSDSNSVLPFSILLVLYLGLLLVLVGAVTGLPEFRSSRGLAQLNSTTRDEMFDRASFRRYNHSAQVYRRALLS